MKKPDLGCLWAKSSPYKPLTTHLIESGEVTRALLGESVFSSDVKRLSEMLGLSVKKTIDTTAYITALHDIGKCHPLFQVNDAFPELSALIEECEMKYSCNTHNFRHELYSFEIVRKLLEENNICDHSTSRKIAGILKIHHQGKSGRAYTMCGTLDESWKALQNDINTVLLDHFCPSVIIIKPEDTDAFCTIVCGLVILSDWIASGEAFAYSDATDAFPNDTYNKAKQFILNSGLKQASFPHCNSFCDLWRNIPEAGMRPLQKVTEYFFGVERERFPAALIIEAPMGLSLIHI